MGVTLALFPSIVALIILIGMIYRGGKIVADQLEATQQNTVAIQELTIRIIAVEKNSSIANEIAMDIQDKVTNGA